MKTKIQKNTQGLFVNAGSYYSTPPYDSIFKEGDLVKTHHFGGSTLAGVMDVESKNTFRDIDGYESWRTRSFGISDYKLLQKNLTEDKFNEILDHLLNYQYSTKESNDAFHLIEQLNLENRQKLNLNRFKREIKPDLIETTLERGDSVDVPFDTNDFQLLVNHENILKSKGYYNPITLYNKTRIIVDEVTTRYIILKVNNLRTDQQNDNVYITEYIYGDAVNELKKI